MIAPVKGTEFENIRTFVIERTADENSSNISFAREKFTLSKGGNFAMRRLPEMYETESI